MQWRPADSGATDRPAAPARFQRKEFDNRQYDDPYKNKIRLLKKTSGKAARSEAPEAYVFGTLRSSSD
jgi:hypothetical protein